VSRSGYSDDIWDDGTFDGADSSRARRNPEMEKYVKIRPVVTEDGEQFCIDLQVTNQRFQVGQYPCETTEEAEWMRDMLCIALAKIVADALPIG